MNPCPCGYLGDLQRDCQCSPLQIRRYRSKLSGPLLDRIDLQIVVARVPQSQLVEKPTQTECQRNIQLRIANAQQRQLKRQGQLNNELSWKDIVDAGLIQTSTFEWLLSAVETLSMSTRTLHRVLKLALTIADLNGDNDIGKQYLKEALAYRQLDKGA